MEIIPAIIPKDFAHLESEVGKVAGLVPRVQIDVMDGKYAPEASWPYNYSDTVFEEIMRKERPLPLSDMLSYEIDMMVENPENHVGNWLGGGADAIIVHIESTNDMGTAIGAVRRSNAELGIAFRPKTPLRVVQKWVSEADFVQVMGNDMIGYHGVPLDPRTYAHLGALRERYPNLILAVDIGVSLATAPQLIEAGANKLVSGSAIFKSGDIGKTIDAFRRIVGRRVDA